jgi:PPOX class probable F420-dependent enzyme
MPILAPGVEEYLRGAHVAALATVRPDGRPHVVPVWYEYDGREFTINCFRDTQKQKNIAWKGFAALSVFSDAIPYQQVTVEGRARVGSALDNVWRERVAMRYLGETAGRAYTNDTADMDVVAVHLRPMKWHVEGFE